MSRAQGWLDTEVVIAESGTASTAIDFRGYRLMALKTGTITGATFAIHACDTFGGTYVAVIDDEGNAVTITATDDAVIGVDSIAGKIAALPFIKLVSASAEAAERTIGVFLTV